MAYIGRHGLLKGCQFFNYILFCAIFLAVYCETQNLNSDELIKMRLRPLKYSKDSEKICEEFCGSITCQPVKACENGVVLKNESYCGCCEACVIFLDEGDTCKDEIKGSLALGSQKRCKKGTICDNGKCKLNVEDTKGLENCLLHRHIRQKRLKSGKYSEDLWIPECDKKGDYEARQETISKSSCFDETGNKVFGSAVDSLEKPCVCSRYMKKKETEDPLSFSLKPQEHCSSSGSFDTLQCIGNLCYCADVLSGQIKSGLVRLDYLDKLPCYNNKSHTKSYLKNCEKELQRFRKLSHQFWKKGVDLLGKDLVKCDPDGSFSQKQCLPDKCVCTDKIGQGIGSYAADKNHLLQIDMTCNCARDQISTPFMSLSCETNGNYSSFSCFEDKCVCVDEEGEIVSKGLEKSKKDTCKQLITDLSDPSDDDLPDGDEDSTSSDYEY